MIFMLAGTSDARALALQLREAGHELLISVVTKEAAETLLSHQLQVRIGRLTHTEMAAVCKEIGATHIVDASHPFADQASNEAIQAAQLHECPYIRYERPQESFADEEVVKVKDYEQAAAYMKQKKAVVFLATGSKTLPLFHQQLGSEEGIELICRMLPRSDNMLMCEEMGFPKKNIIAMQGPYTKAFNQAMFTHYGVTHMITKESGKVGSIDEKVEAAKELGIEIVLIERPQVGYQTVYHTFDEIVRHLKGVEQVGLQNRV